MILDEFLVQLKDVIYHRMTRSHWQHIKFLHDVIFISFICSIILESDPTAITHRVALRGDDIPLGEQTVAQVQYSITYIVVRCMFKSMYG